jgi:hypothetical protein
LSPLDAARCLLSGSKREGLNDRCGRKAAGRLKVADAVEKPAVALGLGLSL